MNTYRTLAAVTLALSAFAAQADSALPRDGDWNNYPLSAQSGSTLTREAVVALAAGPGEPRQKLRAIVSRIVEHVTGPRAHWGSRVVVRELLSPSEHATVLVQQAIAPKARILIGIVSQIVGLPPTHPAMQRSLFFTVAPCLAMLLAPAELRTQVLPGLGGEPAQLADDLLRYALAGMDALGAQYRA
eukprot:gene39540-biopygen33596